MSTIYQFVRNFSEKNIRGITGVIIFLSLLVIIYAFGFVNINLFWINIEYHFYY